MVNMKVILCVTGSIAAVETIKLTRQFKRLGIEIKAFLSDEGAEIIHPNALEFATGEEVVRKLTGKIEHVKYAQADLILVAPATANVISKFSNKIADNPITTLLITGFGHNTPILFVPSMHDSMYKAIGENIEKLKKEGVYFLNPKNEEGKAKFPDKEEVILESLRIANLSNGNADLKDKNILISLGGTYEAIDPIRGIINKSSGKMGLEVAKEAYIRGGNVTLLAGNVSVDILNIFNTVYIQSSFEMDNETLKLVKDMDIFISAAAISDFSPIKKEEFKISSSIDLSLEFKTTEKIIRKIKKIAPNVFLVGFKAEYNISEENIVSISKKQLINAGADLIVANDLNIEGSGFGSDKNEVIFVNEDVEKISLRSKAEISKLLFDRIVDINYL
ncbi:coenzyme A biosynthesis bifunctional protein CoaBC [Methanobrevibacter curvatus]|uniref:Coenzyme A biosynthesis bifunctional protein CoaBC n=2 Tax=Methanobrevibacter curvatus TaxID=49547 RepID=A0A166DUE5_9EURY|nr:coenzyme A biosynthesis bifunctional protein CoaBC [Methanobrevibacter curvatus]